MIKRLSFLALWALLAWTVSGKDFVWMGQSQATTNALGDESILIATYGASSFSTTLADSAQNKYLLTKITSATNATVAKAEIYLVRVGTGSAASLTVQIYHDAAGNPGALLASSPSALGASEITTSAQFYSWPISATLTNGGVYWLGIRADSVSSTYYNFYCGSFGSGLMYRSSDGTNWANATSRQGYVRLYK